MSSAIISSQSPECTRRPEALTWGTCSQQRVRFIYLHATLKPQLYEVNKRKGARGVTAHTWRGSPPVTPFDTGREGGGGGRLCLKQPVLSGPTTANSLTINPNESSGVGCSLSLPEPGVSPVQPRRLPPRSHTSWIVVPPCTSLIRAVWPLLLRWRLAARALQGLESENCPSVTLVFPSVLGPLRLRRPALWAVWPPACLRWPTLTPSSSFLRTRKQLALLTPNRGLALAALGLERRPPGGQGTGGGTEGVRGQRYRPQDMSVTWPGLLMGEGGC